MTAATLIFCTRNNVPADQIERSALPPLVETTCAAAPSEAQVFRIEWRGKLVTRRQLRRHRTRLVKAGYRIDPPWRANYPDRRQATKCMGALRRMASALR